MARYVVEVEGEGESAVAAASDGLTVAKALARKRSLKSTHAVVVRDSQTGKVVARFEPQGVAEPPQPTLASSVKRMRAANDRLKQALVPSTSGRKKRA
jgi:anti-sigma factor RsiW